VSSNRTTRMLRPNASRVRVIFMTTARESTPRASHHAPLRARRWRRASRTL